MKKVVEHGTLNKYRHHRCRCDLCKSVAMTYAREYRLKRRFNLTQEDYDILFEQQNGVCDICGGTNNGRTLAVDHNHVTGAVRGLLCLTCNAAIGMLQDDITLLASAIVYLKKF